MSLQFWEYRLASDAICLGERIKKGTYRYSITTIPYSQASGALRAVFGGQAHAGEIHAVGCFKVPNPDDPEDVARHLETKTYNLRDVARGTAKLTIDTTILVNVEGKVYVLINDFTAGLPSTIGLRMGALRNKGLGYCKLSRTRKWEEYGVRTGLLTTRLPENRLELFGIEEVIKPVYGYLFEPDAAYESGTYVRSLFEGSLLKGPEFLISERR